MEPIKVVWAMSEAAAVLLGLRALNYTPVADAVADPTALFVVLGAAGAVSLADKLRDTEY